MKTLKQLSERALRAATAVNKTRKSGKTQFSEPSAA
jgi:hypothetical protein